MQSVKFSCGSCRRGIEAGTGLCGSVVQCPHCNQQNRVPLASGRLVKARRLTAAGVFAALALLAAIVSTAGLINLQYRLQQTEAAVAILQRPVEPAPIPQAAQDLDELRVKALHLVDDNGETLATIGSGEDGHGLYMFNSDGDKRVALEVRAEDGGANFNLFSRSRHPAVGFSVPPNGSSSSKISGVTLENGHVYFISSKTYNQLYGK